MDNQFHNIGTRPKCKLPKPDLCDPKQVVRNTIRDHNESQQSYNLHTLPIIGEQLVYQEEIRHPWIVFLIVTETLDHVVLQTVAREEEGTVASELGANEAYGNGNSHAGPCIACGSGVKVTGEEMKEESWDERDQAEHVCRDDKKHGGARALLGPGHDLLEHVANVVVV